MNDFKVLLQAVLDTNNIGRSDIDKVQKIIDKYHLNLTADLDKATMIAEIKKIVPQLEAELKKVTGIDIQIDDSSILKSINQVERHIQAVTSKAHKIQLSMDEGNYDTRITGYETALTNLGLSATEVSNHMKNVKATFAELQTSASGTNIIPEDVVSKAQALETEMAKVSNTVKQIKLKESLNADDLSVENTIVRLNEQLRKNSAYSKDAKKQIRSWIEELSNGTVATARLKQINTQAKSLHASMGQLNKIGFSWMDKFKQGFSKISGWLVITKVVRELTQYLKFSIEEIIKLDTALVDLKKTTSMTETQLEDFYFKANDLAKQLGVTTEEIINQASAWSRLGYSSAEAATTMAKLSSQFAAISPDMDVDEATDGLVSIMKAFDIAPDEALDGILSKVNEIGNTAATSNGEIVNMLAKSSSAMKEANNTLEETIALETAAVEITRDDDSVGTAFKTVSMRIRGYDEETESYIGNVEELSGTIADLTKTASTPGGISLFTDANKTEYKSTYQLLKEISEVYDELDDKTQAQLLEALAGKRQGQIIAATINNFEAAEKAMETMANSAGSADEEMAIIVDSIDYKLNKLKETGVGIAQNIIDSDAVKAGVDLLNLLAGAIDTITDKIGVLTPLLGGVGITAFVRNLG